MTPLPFSSLTKQQRKQAAYLFADALFGTDAGAYLYELDKAGDVKGRQVISNKCEVTNKRAAIRPPVMVTIKEEAYVTNEMIQHARMNMDALAACVARRIYQQQLEEVRS